MVGIEQLAFAGSHRRCLIGRAVVVSEDMQHAVNDQKCDLVVGAAIMLSRDPVIGGPGQGVLRAYDDITQEQFAHVMFVHGIDRK